MFLSGFLAQISYFSYTNFLSHSDSYSDASASSLDRLDVISQQMTVVSKRVGSLQAESLSLSANVECVQNTLNETSSKISTLASAHNGMRLFQAVCIFEQFYNQYESI